MQVLLPDEPEIQGLLALMLLHDERRPARRNLSGGLLTLEMQDRRLWERTQINRGQTLLVSVLARGSVRPYQVQAAISAVHGDAPDCARTNWGEICLHYAKLYDLQPSPIVALNAAVARSFAEGPTAGLTALDALAGAETLTAYQPFHMALADMLRRAGDRAGAHADYQTAYGLSENISERRFIASRISETAPNTNTA